MFVNDDDDDEDDYDNNDNNNDDDNNNNNNNIGRSMRNSSLSKSGSYFDSDNRRLRVDNRHVTRSKTLAKVFFSCSKKSELI